MSAFRDWVEGIRNDESGQLNYIIAVLVVIILIIIILRLT